MAHERAAFSWMTKTPVYRDAVDEPGQLDVEFGVGITAPVTAVGDVRPVDLPVGAVATTTHRGPYTGLGAAHAAVLAWCRAHSLALAGPRWEVYGHWIEGELPRTDIYYLLRPPTEASSEPRAPALRGARGLTNAEAGMFPRRGHSSSHSVPSKAAETTLSPDHHPTSEAL